MRPERDHRIISLAGTLFVGLGSVLLLLTFLATLFTLFALPSGNLVPGALTVLICVIMASTLMSCGAQLSRITSSHVTINEARLSWSALLIVMILGGTAAIWLMPYVAVLALFVALLQLAIRPALIRLA
jgi:hypothetical protein